MAHVSHANVVRNTDLSPDPRAYRLLIDRNLAPDLAAAIASSPIMCRRMLGDLNPGPIETRARRRA